MQYLMIMGALIAVALILIIIIVVVLVKGRKVDDYEDEYDEDEEDDYDDYDEEEEYEQPRRRRPVRQEQRQEPVRARETSQRKAPVKKQWKLILENLETWEKYTFIFYDNIGIGRGRRTPEFEKYISIQDDPRISKLHCAIIRNEDKLYLKDMDSRNGTYLNGKQIHRPVVIQRDDVIGIGETKIEIKKILRERD